MCEVREKIMLGRKVFALVLLPTLVISPTLFLDPINWPKQIALLVVIPIVLFEFFRYFSALVRFRSTEVRLFISALSLIAIAAVLNFENVATTFWGTWGRNNGLATLFSLMTIAFVVSFLVRIKEFAELFVKAISIVTFPAMVYGMIQLLGLDPLDWSVKNSVFSFYGNTNFASAVFALSSLSSILTIIVFKPISVQRFFYSIQAVGSIVVMFATNSVQGPVALIAGIAIWFYFFLSVKNLLLSRVFMVSSLAAGILIFMGFLGSGPLGSYIYQYTLKLRTFYWLAGINMGISSPISGVGVDSYGDYYRQNRSIETIKATSIDLTVSNAHNSAIQIFATMGLLGLLAYLMIFVPGILLLLKSLIRPTKVQNGIELPLIVLFASSFALSMISIDNISVAIFTWSLAGACFGIYFQSSVGDTLKLNEFVKNHSAKTNKRGKSSVDTLRPIILTSFTFLALLIPWYSSTAERTIASAYKEPYVNLEQADKDKFVGKLFTFAENFPIMQGSHYNYLMQIIVRDPNYNIIAARIGDSAVDTFPLDYGLLDVAAVTKENLGRWDEALALRLKQLEIDARHPRVRAYLAKDLIELKRNSEAREAIEISRRWAREFNDQGTLNYLQQLEKLLT